MDKIQQINCSYPNLSFLYSAYMPFIKGGGLFIRTCHQYQLGSVVSVSLIMMEEDEPYWINGKIVWITPKTAQSDKLPGIGVQFIDENSRYLCNKIEAYLAGMLKLPQLTDTI